MFGQFEKTLKNQKLNYSLLALLLFISYFIFSEVKDFGFINYDDDVYVTANPDILDFSWNGIKKIFFDPENKEEIKPPLAVASFAINYYFSGLDAKSYHLTNLFFHLLNIVLVFIVLNKVLDNKSIAFLSTSIFAIHPFNVEAVVWVSARKDVQYGFFFLIALYLFLKYLDEKKWWQYLMALLAFVLSFYSKFAAVSFPILIIGISLFWKNRKDYQQIALESLPFLFVPIWPYIRGFYYSIVYYDQSKPIKNVVELIDKVERSSVLNYHDNFNFLEKIFLGGYSFIQYIVKYFYPNNLQLIYPYPLHENGWLPKEYYIYTTISIAIVVSVLYFYIKKEVWKNKLLNFGILFFFINVTLLLHILPIGGRVIIAERYMYLPQIGLLIIAFYFFKQIIEKYKNLEKTAPYILIIAFVALCYQTSARLPVWKNVETMLLDLINKEPEYPVAYNNLGHEYIAQKRHKEALPLLKKALEIDPNYVEALNNLGALYTEVGNNEMAKKYLKETIEVNDRYIKAYYNLANIYSAEKKLDLAIENYERAIELNNKFYLAYNNLGNIYLNELDNYEKAIELYTKAYESNPNFSIAIFNRGVAYSYKLKNFEKGIEDYNKAIEINKNYADAYINRGNAFFELKNYQAAIQDYSNNIRILGNNVTSYVYINRAIAYLNIGKNKDACNDLQIANNKGDGKAPALISQYCK